MARLRYRYTWVNIEGEELDDSKTVLSRHGVNQCMWDDLSRMFGVDGKSRLHVFRALAVEEVSA